MVRVSVIGCGNMGSALVRGLARAGHDGVIVYDIDPDAFEAVAGLDVVTTTEIGETEASELVFLAVKPHLVAEVLEDLDLTDAQTLVTIAAGVPTDFVATRTEARVIRLMPNLAAEWGSMAGAVTGPVTDEVREVLEDLGAVAELDEALMDTATALNGSGPAFVFYLIDAMVAAGVAQGFDRANARTLAAQTFKGGAETVLRGEEPIEDLIDAVCSPQGTTLEGMRVLRASNVDETIAGALDAAQERAVELSEEVRHD